MMVGRGFTRCSFYLPTALRNRRTPWAPFLDCQKEGKEQPKGTLPFGNLLFYWDMRGDVPTPYEFAVMHFTRFRPVRGRAVGGFLFASRKKPGPPLCNTMCCTHCFPRTLLYCTNCGEVVTFIEYPTFRKLGSRVVAGVPDFPPSLRTSAHTGAPNGSALGVWQSVFPLVRTAQLQNVKENGLPRRHKWLLAMTWLVASVPPIQPHPQRAEARG